MRTQWGKAKYDSQFGEGDDVKFAKRHWAPRIIQHSAEQLQAMLNAADSQRISGNAKFDWPDPAAILSLASNAWERQAHKPYQSDRGIEDLTAKDSRKREGLEQIKKLMAGAQVPEKKSRDHGDWYKRVEADTQKWVADCRTAYARVRARIEDTQAASDYYYDIHWEEIKKRYGVPKK